MLQLREIQPQDMDTIRQWRNSPEVSKFMYTDHYISQEEHAKWFSSILENPKCSYWIIVCDSKDVGLAGLYDVNYLHKRAYWAFYVADPQVRGRGIGSFVEYAVLRYAFEDLDLNKLCCEVLATNEAVMKMHKAVGFVQEGIFREHVIKGDQICDVVALAMLRKDWESSKSKLAEDLDRKKRI